MIVKSVSAAALAVWVVATAAGQAPQASQTPAQAPQSAYQVARRLPARILGFSVAPASIQPGQSVTLKWAVENPSAIEIDQGVGPVRPKDQRKLTPSATTTYTLTVRGPNGVLTKTATVTVAGTVPVVATAANTAPKKTPRMADGKPDLSGVYNSSSIMFLGRSATGWRDPIVAPLKPGAENFKVVRGPEDTGLTSDCRPTGVPEAYFMPYQFEIVQGVNQVVILYEYPHLFRVVTIGGSHPLDPDPTWMGDSVGHWEGDILVIDAIGFNDKTELPGGYRHSEALHVVERFHRIDADNLEWEATIEDPNVFAKPWTLKRSFPLRPELAKVDEFVCENNRDYTPLFKK